MANQSPIKKTLKIGVMGGSFNPVHAGHIAVADCVRRRAGLDRVLMMLSPLNPLKAGSTELLADADRSAMLRIACAPYEGLEACDMELSMPRPSFTINTLRRLQADLGPAAEIYLIIGEDNWAIFDRWRSHDEILRDFKVIVYPRNGDSASALAASRTSASQPMIVEAPTVDVSSTQLRSAIARGDIDEVSNLMPAGVVQYIKDNKLYGYNS